MERRSETRRRRDKTRTGIWSSVSVEEEEEWRLREEEEEEAGFSYSCSAERVLLERGRADMRGWGDGAETGSLSKRGQEQETRATRRDGGGRKSEDGGV